MENIIQRSVIEGLLSMVFQNDKMYTDKTNEVTQNGWIGMRLESRP